jgi:hypothetical protein
MRYNIFAQQDGTAYGALFCSVCSKNVAFELEQQADLSAYGEGSRVLNMLGAPKPPNVPRQKTAGNSVSNDQTL